MAVALYITLLSCLMIMAWRKVIVALRQSAPQATERDKVQDAISAAIADCQDYCPCMSLEVSRDGKSVTLHLDTALDTIDEWIPGEGADISLMRHRETGKVAGVRLPLYNELLVVSYDGPLRVNAGFRKDDGVCS